MKRLNLVLVLIFTLGYFVTVELALNRYEQNMLLQIEENTKLDLKEKAHRLQSEIYQDFTLIYGMEAYITENFLENESDTNVHAFISKIYAGSNNRVLSLVIAPKGIYKYVYPVIGNEKLLNFNIFNDNRPDVQMDLKRAKATKDIIVSKPYNLLQGTNGIVARKALFKDHMFWGYTSIGLSTSAILEQAGLNDDRHGIRVSIRFPGDQAFFGKSELFTDGNSFRQTIKLPEGKWEFAALPSEEDLSKLDEQLLLFRFSSYLIGLLMLIIISILMTQKARLDKIVEARTSELNHAHNELSEIIEEMKASEAELRNRNDLLKNYTNALEESEEKLTHLAFFDQLTGIANRRKFTDVLEQCLQDFTISGAVIYFDLDNFKMVNDTYGHATGDILLKGVAERISKADLPIREFARLGGDEFAIIVTDKDSNGAREIAQQILTLFQTPFQLPEKWHYINASIGISLFDDSQRSFKTLLNQADITMYNAKRSGGNKVKIFHEDMNKNAINIMELSNDLRNAIQRNEMVLHYQPQVDSRSGNIIGVEALVRWNHPEKGLLSPAHFIGLAEATGLIVELGEWVLRNACEDMMHLKASGHPALPLAINLSAQQFEDEALVSKMKKIMEETGFPPELLEFEVTESTAMKDEQLQILNEIQELGISISIDDFGTHYSSLSYLKRFPINKVKIDRTFIRGMNKDDKNLAILRAIIFVAKELNLDLIAEGVETEEEVRILSDYDCFQIQGFHFFKPLPFNELKEKLN